MTEIKNLRYTNEEMTIIKNTFNNLDLLKAIRKVFLQMTLSGLDQSLLSLNMESKDTLKVLRKTFLPELEPDAPIHQVIDLWMTIEIKDKTPDEAMPHITARELLIGYLDQQLKVLEGKLEGKGKEEIKFKDFTIIPRRDEVSSFSEVYSNLIVRNMIIIHIEQMLNQLNILSLVKDKEEIEEDRKKDSSK